VSPATVLIADAQEAFRVGLVRMLKAEPDITVVGEACNCPEAINKALQLKPRVILMDLNLALRQGDKAIARIRETIPLAMIVIIADSLRDDDVLQALSAGAQGYMMRSSPHTEIAWAIKRAALGEVVLSPSIALRLMKELQEIKARPNLSSREEEVLDLLGQGLSNIEIAERLVVSLNTVKTHIHRLRGKLALRSRRDLSNYATRRQMNASPNYNMVSPALDVTEPSFADTTLSPRQESSVIEPVTGEYKQATALSLELDWHSDIPKSIMTEKPEELIEDAIDIMTNEVRRHQGTVVWFRSSGFIALFGVPGIKEHAPQRALNAALSISEHAKQYGNQVRKSGIRIDARLGVNSGDVLVEGKGDDANTNYIRTGITSDLAVKAQDTAQPGAIVVTHNTYQLIKNEFSFEPLGQLRIKEEEPVKTYLLLEHSPGTIKPQSAVAHRLKRFVGRDREIEALKEAYARAEEGSGQVIGILGEAGIGKSRLLAEFIEELPHDRSTCLEGSCIHHGDSVPFLPFLQSLRCYFSIVEVDSEPVICNKMKAKITALDEGLMTALAPLQDILALAVADNEYMKLEPMKKRERLFEAVRDLLLLDSRARTIVCVIEDCQWIDKTSEELLSYLIDSLSAARILFIMLYRPEYSHSWAGRSNYSQIRLNELPAQASADLAQSILGEGKPSPDLQQFIIDRCGGNPLFLEEMISSLLENGCIDKRDNCYVMNMNPSQIKIPSSIRDTIAARIDRLDPDAKYVAQTASVIGREFSYKTLEAIARDKQNLKHCLLRLQSADFLCQQSVFPEPRYMFKHVLIQEGAYHSLPRKYRREIHQSIAQALEQQYRGRLEEVYEFLSYHNLRGQNLVQACHYLKLSGDKASRRSSNTEALHLYQQALDTLQKQDESQDNLKKQLELRLAMDRPLRSLDYPEGSLKNCQEAVKLADSLNDEVSKSTACSNLGWYHMVHGQPELGLTEMETAFYQAADAEAPDLVVPVAINLVQAFLATANFKKLVEVANAACPLLEKTGRESVYSGGICSENAYCTLLTWSGSALAMMGEFEKSKLVLEKSLAYARKINDTAAVAIALEVCGASLYYKGDCELALQYLNESLPTLKNVGNSMILGACWGSLGITHMLLGDCRRAMECIENGLALQQQSGANPYLCNFFWAKGWVAIEDGRFPEARCALEECIRIAQINESRGSEGCALVLLARTLSKMENPDYLKAEQSIISGMQIFNEFEMRPWHAMGQFYLGELFTNKGNKDEALESLKKAESEFRRMGMDYWLRKAHELQAKLQV